jgi:hypothetical protein
MMSTGAKREEESEQIDYLIISNLRVEVTLRLQLFVNEVMKPMKEGIVPKRLLFDIFK